MNWIYKTKDKVEKEEAEKYWIIDYSFYMWNGSFAYKRPCNCLDSFDQPKQSCDKCEGTGKIYMHASDGTITGGLYAVFRMAIERAMQGYKVVTVFDPPKEQLKRTQLLPTYKGNRGEKPEWISKQIDLGKELLPLTNVECYTSEEDESDDVMAALAVRLADEGHYVVVASDDKDMFPLVQHPNIDIFRMREMFTYEDFKAKFSFEPIRFNEYLAICGDAADNFNLMDGLGPKAAEWMINNTEKSVVEIFDSLDDVPRKYYKKLIKCNRGDAKCKNNKSGCNSCGNYIETKQDFLELSLKIATLELEAEYEQVKKDNDLNRVHVELNRLDMKWVAERIHLLF